MPTIQVLNQRHPGVDVTRLRELQALYEGDEKFEALLNTFLPKRFAEPDQRYDIRKKEAHYRNYLGPIIDYFAALLFSNRPEAVAKPENSTAPVADPGEFYGRFREDCDLNGADIDALMKDRLTDAMVNRCSWLLIEHANDGGVEPENLREYEVRKLGDCWVTPLDATEVLDWDSDALGLEWVIIHSKEAKRAGVGGGRGRITERWKYITRTDTTTFAITYEARQPPPQTEDVPQMGEPVPHKFGRVPVVCLELKVGLWVASRLKTPQLAHFRLSNALSWGSTQTCYAMPVFRLKEDEKGKFRPPTMGAGYGIYIGAQDSVDWLAPPTQHLDSLAGQVAAQKDEIYRIALQMALGVENNAAAIGRSGESKTADNAATTVILKAYAKNVKETLEVVYDLISHARGEKYTWSVEGLDDIAATQLSELVDILDKVAVAGGIPSKTWNTHVKTRLAEATLPDVAQDVKQAIRAEIKDGVEKEENDDAQALELGRQLMKMGGAHNANYLDEKKNPGGGGGRGGAKPPKSPPGRGGRTPPPPA